MGKQGPCYHCGVTSTPLWRNGPPEKPVLCNACGSRWRTKGTLANYTPLHSRADPDDIDVQKVSKVKIISINKNKDMKLLKRKQNNDNVAGGVAFNYNQSFQKIMDEDTSYKSSSGSVISNSESCAQFGADASDLTDPAQSIVWDSMVPSRKRTCINRPKSSHVEKLTKDLYTILHEQQSAYFYGSSEEDLLYESEAPMVSVEIGHGSILIRHPSSIAREEESEASSLSVDSKQNLTNEAFMHPAALPTHIDKNGVNFQIQGSERNKNYIGKGMLPEQSKRVKVQHEILEVLGNYNSPLSTIDLEDVLNFKEFVRHLTNEEQQQLLKYLPSVDAAELPDSLRNMFHSPQFMESLSSFQQLLTEGLIDASLSGVKTEDNNTLKRLALFNLTKSKWVECYNLLKVQKCKNTTAASAVSGHKAIASSNLANIKRSLDGQCLEFPETKITMKSAKKLGMKTSNENKELVDNYGSCFSPTSLFALPPDSSSLMLDSLHFTSGSCDQDLLLDVPSNCSFPQAELLHPTSSFGVQEASVCSSSTYRNPMRP